MPPSWDVELSPEYIQSSRTYTDKYKICPAFSNDEDLEKWRNERDALSRVLKAVLTLETKKIDFLPKGERGYLRLLADHPWEVVILIQRKLVLPHEAYVLPLFHEADKNPATVNAIMTMVEERLLHGKRN